MCVCVCARARALLSMYIHVSVCMRGRHTERETERGEEGEGERASEREVALTCGADPNMRNPAREMIEIEVSPYSESSARCAAGRTNVLELRSSTGGRR